MYSERCDLCHDQFNLLNKLPYALSCGDIICKDCCKAILQRQTGIIEKCRVCKSQINQNYTTMNPLKSIIKQLQDGMRQIWYCNIHEKQEISFFCYFERQYGCNQCINEHLKSHPQETKSLNSKSVSNYVQFLENHFGARVHKYFQMHQKIQIIRQKPKIKIQAVLSIEQDLIRYFQDETIDNLSQMFQGIKKNNPKHQKTKSEFHQQQSPEKNRNLYQNNFQSLLTQQYESLQELDQDNLNQYQNILMQEMENQISVEDNFEVDDQQDINEIKFYQSLKIQEQPQQEPQQQSQPYYQSPQQPQQQINIKQMSQQQLINLQKYNKLLYQHLMTLNENQQQNYIFSLSDKDLFFETINQTKQKLMQKVSILQLDIIMIQFTPKQQNQYIEKLKQKKDLEQTLTLFQLEILIDQLDFNQQNKFRLKMIQIYQQQIQQILNIKFNDTKNIEQIEKFIDKMNSQQQAIFIQKINEIQQEQLIILNQQNIFIIDLLNDQQLESLKSLQIYQPLQSMNKFQQQNYLIQLDLNKKVEFYQILNTSQQCKFSQLMEISEQQQFFQYLHKLNIANVQQKQSQDQNFQQDLNQLLKQSNYKNQLFNLSQELKSQNQQSLQIFSDQKINKSKQSFNQNQIMGDINDLQDDQIELDLLQCIDNNKQQNNQFNQQNNQLSQQKNQIGNQQNKQLTLQNSQQNIQQNLQNSQQNYQKNQQLNYQNNYITNYQNNQQTNQQNIQQINQIQQNNNNFINKSKQSLDKINLNQSQKNEIINQSKKNIFDNSSQLIQSNSKSIQDNKLITEIIQQTQKIIRIDLIKEPEKQKIQQWLNVQNLKIKLIYRASRDGFEFKDFHSKCDNIDKTILVIISEHDQLFGGYVDLPWNNKGSYIQGNGKSFLFSLTKNTKHRCLNRYKELIGSSKSLAVFGEGHDLVIGPNSHQYPNSYSNLGKFYEIAPGLTYQTDQARSYLAGSYDFKIENMEVYKILE